MTKEQIKTINKDIDFIQWILEYYKLEFEKYCDDGEIQELYSDFTQCKNRLNDLLYIINQQPKWND